MRKSFWALASLAIFAFVMPAKAQDETPKAEVYAGYDYVRLDARGTSYNFNGGSGQFAYNANNWLGVVGDFGGYYTNNGFTGGIISYMAGPRINFRGHGNVTPFVQALFGGAHSITTTSENAFAMTVGGGVDIKITEHFAIRPVQAEYFMTRFADGPSNQQNNFRFSAGVVFRFAKR